MTTAATAGCDGAGRATGAAAADVPLIGLVSTSASPDCIEAFRRSLSDYGYTVGEDVRVDVRLTKDPADLPRLINELIANDVDVIVAGGTLSALEAKSATSTIPIVMTHSGDPVGLKLVESLSRPGGNVTGLTHRAPDLCEKRLELLKEAFPSVRRVGVLWNPKHPTAQASFGATTKAVAAAPALELQLLPEPVQAFDQVAAAVQRAKDRQADALLVIRDPLMVKAEQMLAEAATSHGLPTMHETSNFVYAGGVISYGPSLAAMYARSAEYVDAILKGADPSNMEVSDPQPQPELVVNKAAAKSTGVTIADSVLEAANVVLE